MLHLLLEETQHVNQSINQKRIHNIVDNVLIEKGRPVVFLQKSNHQGETQTKKP